MTENILTLLQNFKIQIHTPQSVPVPVGRVRDRHTSTQVDKRENEDQLLRCLPR